jgi:hypothetical protein
MSNRKASYRGRLARLATKRLSSITQSQETERRQGAFFVRSVECEYNGLRG